MNQQMSISNKFWPLLNAACDGTLLATEIQELEAVLDSDLAARKVFADHFKLKTAIRFWVGQKGSRNVGLAGVRATFPQALQSTFLSTTLRNTLGYFSEGMPLAYLLATVITGLGLLVGSFIHVSGPEEVARSVPVVAEPLVVGRITGMVDCKWNGGSRVSFGQKVDLASGLMEITYDTGAKVILQGPVTYSVETNGGYLAVGKLTGKLEKKLSNPQSISSHPFFIRTPTATVTDLGTEFGVEVSKDGTSDVHVLQGTVQTQFRNTVGIEPRILELHAGEARRYGVSSGRAVVIPANWARFESLRILPRDERYQRWLAYSKQLRKDPALVAYYTFESPGGRRLTVPNQSAAGHVLDGGIYYGAQWVEGRLPGKLGLRFHGPNSGDRVIVYEQERFQFSGSFSVAVWFKLNRFTAASQALVTKGDNSWRVQQHGASQNLAFGTNPAPDDIDPNRTNVTDELVSQSEVTDGRWHLAVAVYSPSGGMARKQLFIDGRLEAERKTPGPLMQNEQPVWFGNLYTITPLREIDGVIDEVAIFGRVLSAEEIADMFQAGCPAKPADGKGGGL